VNLGHANKHQSISAIKATNTEEGQKEIRECIR
jgi:hypothetical protein